MARLTPAARNLLSISAVLGGGQEFTLLRRAWPSDDGSLQDAIGEAVASGMLLESPGPRLEYRFAHELVRRAVYDSLPGLARARLHHRMAQALQAAVTTLPDGLTARELAVLRLITQGRSNRAIGRELSISEHTAANHLNADRLACYCLYQSACPHPTI